jgi:SAM-dependent methyltransferase
VTDEAHAGFTPTGPCWVCGAGGQKPVNRAIFELSAYAEQDPELARYTGATVDLVRCAACGFAQPAALPSLPDYFGRMYDQRWSDEWMEAEFHDGTKDLIFREVVDRLSDRVPARQRTLLDLGAHVGRLIQVAAQAGWRAEGVELNPRTSAYAARATGLPVHRADLRDLVAEGRRYAAVTLIDVLEHIPQPVEALQGIRQVLQPGGWIAVKVPHGPNQLIKERIRGRVLRGYRPTVADNLVHVSHFTAGSLRMALERAGFVDVSITTAAPVLPPPAAGAARAGQVAVRRGMTMAARLLRGGTHTPLAMNLQAYARAFVDGP